MLACHTSFIYTGHSVSQRGGISYLDSIEWCIAAYSIALLGFWPWGGLAIGRSARWGDTMARRPVSCPTSSTSALCRSEVERTRARIGSRWSTAGTLVASKGIYTLAAVVERVPDVVFQLVGDGPADSRDGFIRHLEGRGLADRVELLEARPNDRVLALLAEADVFFFPSMREGLPFSILEAMAVGLPVVASNVGAIAEIVDVPAGGILLQPEDVDGFARALNRLRLQPTLRREMGEHNRAKTQQHYDYDVVVKQLCCVYDEVLAG